MFYANKGFKLGKYIQMCCKYIKIIKKKLLKSYMTLSTTTYIGFL